MQKTAQLFFENHIGQPAQDFAALAQSGSARCNYIAKDHVKTYVVTQNDNVRENESFIYLSQVFSDLGLNTPKILAVSPDRTIYIQDYLGGHTLSEVIATEGLTDRVKNLVKLTITQLYQFQIKTNQQIDFDKAFEYESYNDLPVIHDLYYFKNFLVDVLELPYHKSTLLKEFKAISALIVNLQPRGVMIRDFQSRNIMVDDLDNVHFIDYQAAMEGPLMYDVISFLFQAKANLPDAFKTEMINYYYQLWSSEEIHGQLQGSLMPLLMMRYLQVLGAYGFRGLIQRKSHFIESLDLGIQNIGTLSQQWPLLKGYPELFQIIQQLQTDVVKAKIRALIKA